MKKGVQRKENEAQINCLRLGDWEVDFFLCDDGRLGMTVYKGQLARGAEDVRPWVDVYVMEADDQLEVTAP